MNKVVVWLSKVQHTAFDPQSGIWGCCIRVWDLMPGPVGRSRGHIHLIQKLLWTSSCATAVLHLSLYSPVPLWRGCQAHHQRGAGLRIRSSRRETWGWHEGNAFYKVLGYAMTLAGEHASSLWVVAAGERSLIEMHHYKRNIYGEPG